jgi:flagellar hook-basal body complex protein FliE
MTVSPVAPHAANGTASASHSAPVAGSGTGGFSRLLTGFLETASSQQQHAEQAIANLAAGRASNVHNVMLSMAKADLSFHLVLELRNRLTDAYREIMSMQI